MTANDFKQEVALLYPWLLSKAFYLCRNKADAEDLTMEVICRMLENSHRFDTDLPIKPWALVILNNTFCTWYNREHRASFTSLEAVNSFQTYIPHPDEYTEAKVTLYVVKRYASKSNMISSVILHAKGYSYAEIGKVFNIPIGTVRSRISAGRKILGKSLMSQ
jgi:RNA polymerase sigma factor, sigma-70 family